MIASRPHVQSTRARPSTRSATEWRRQESSLEKRRFRIPEGGWFEVDGHSESPPILCEAWAHIGPVKSAQKNKVMADAFKLLYASQFVDGQYRRILLFADQAAAEHFRGSSWMARALAANAIEVEIIDLAPETRILLLQAQQRQYR